MTGEAGCRGGAVRPPTAPGTVVVMVDVVTVPGAVAMEDGSGGLSKTHPRNH